MSTISNSKSTLDNLSLTILQFQYAIINNMTKTNPAIMDRCKKSKYRDDNAIYLENAPMFDDIHSIIRWSQLIRIAFQLTYCYGEKMIGMNIKT